MDSSRLPSIVERWAMRKFFHESQATSWGKCAFQYLLPAVSAKEENEDPISLLNGKDLGMLLLAIVARWTMWMEGKERRREHQFLSMFVSWKMERTDLLLQISTNLKPVFSGVPSHGRRYPGTIRKYIINRCRCGSSPGNPACKP